MLGLLSVQVETLFHFDFFSSLDFESFHTLKKEIVFSTFKCKNYKRQWALCKQVYFKKQREIAHWKKNVRNRKVLTNKFSQVEHSNRKSEKD